MPARDRFANRRPAETAAFERDRSRYAMTVDFHPDGRVGEILLSADRADSLLDVLTSDTAILAAVALQYGAPITHALRRKARRVAASPIRLALDLIT
jgi:hypothetical protein